MGQLKAHGQKEGEHELEERLAIAKQLKVGRFILKINGDSPVFAWLFRSASHESLLGHQVSSDDVRHDGGDPLKSQDHHAGLRALPLKAMECGKTCRRQLDMRSYHVYDAVYSHTPHKTLAHYRADSDRAEP